MTSIYDVSQPGVNDILSYNSFIRSSDPQITDSRSVLVPEGRKLQTIASEKETGRFEGEKPLKPEELRSLFKDEQPKQTYIEDLKVERDLYDNKLKELQRKIQVLTAQHSI